MRWKDPRLVVVWWLWGAADPSIHLHQSDHYKYPATEFAGADKTPERADVLSLESLFGDNVRSTT